LAGHSPVGVPSVVEPRPLIVTFVSVWPHDGVANSSVCPTDAAEITAQADSLVGARRLIFASGFEAGTDYRQCTGFEVIGHDGLTLTDK
jgi:hypothetical protein